MPRSDLLRPEVEEEVERSTKTTAAQAKGQLKTPLKHAFFFLLRITQFKMHVFALKTRFPLGLRCSPGPCVRSLVSTAEVEEEVERLSTRIGAAQAKVAARDLGRVAGTG